MDYAAFDSVSLYRTNQQVILGTVLYPPATTYAEYGVQFIGLDAYTPDEIARWFRLVTATIYPSNNAATYYMPTFEQSEVARTNADAFANWGFRSLRWTVGHCEYLLLGRLGARPAEVLPCGGRGRRLQRWPAPAHRHPAHRRCAGRHTAGGWHPHADPPRRIPIPPFFPSRSACPSRICPMPTTSRVQGLVGHKVIVRATVTSGVAQIKVLDVEGQLDPGLEAEMLALKVPALINFLPKQSYGALWTNTDILVPTDIRYFGGKAANYGLLRRYIPTNCPIAIAFSFDLWDAFLDQTLPGGGTLRAEIGARLGPYTNYPPDIASLKTNLAAIRDLFTKTASFTTAQQQAITNALIPFFNPRRNIRFRSSTNVEDSRASPVPGFTTAKRLLMDEMDGDTAGPCQCDSTEPKEKGVFRAIQKVYASFYNDDAYLERLMHRVDESQVAMGLLVHHSFPDEEELANGVATPTFSFTPYSTNATGDMVTQLGAVSVTNPDGSSVPEIVSGKRYNSSYTLTLKQYSSLVPLGDYVLDWQANYRGFLDLFTRVGVGFRQFIRPRTISVSTSSTRRTSTSAWWSNRSARCPGPAPPTP